MSAINGLVYDEADLLRVSTNLITPGDSRIRVAVFGSFMGGYHVLRELLFGELSRHIQVVGVATDDPSKPYTNPRVRLWKYPHSQDDETLVRRFAHSMDIPVFTGRVRCPDFYELTVNGWRPDLCLMATFGQKIPKHIIEVPRLGFYNFHHSGPIWPSYPGPDPIAAMQRDGLKHLVLTVHRVNELIDDGEFFARSHPVPIPQGINAIQMHRITWPQMGSFIRRVTNEICGSPDRSGEAMTLHDFIANYRVPSERFCFEIGALRLAGDCMAELRTSR